MSQKIAKKYNCETCNYRTSNIFDFNKHNSTRKHIKSTDDDKLSTNIIAYSCNKCNIAYKERSGLWRHIRKCSHTIETIIEPAIVEDIIDNSLNNILTVPPVDLSIMLELIKQNQEFKELLIEQNKKLMEYDDRVRGCAPHLRVPRAL